jgi:hypothetical protein
MAAGKALRGEWRFHRAGLVRRLTERAAGGFQTSIPA